MSTQPRPNDDPAGAARDIFRKQISAAVEELGDDDARASAADIHAARKQLKRARATLRLLRDALGDEEYRAVNIEVRDAARPLSAVRDSEVLEGALQDVVKHSGHRAKHVDLDELQAELQRERAHLRRTGADRKQLAKVQESLRSVERRARKWALDDAEWPVLESGLRRVYRRGRKARKTARASPTTENLHEWRKQAKYLWHQLQVLESLSSDAAGELAGEMHDLSDHLGDEHDLAVLRERVSRPASGLDEQSADALRSLIDDRREELRDKAFALGGRSYEDKPKAFIARFHR